MRTDKKSIPVRSVFKCATCGAEWGNHRGNRKTQVGSICGATLRVGDKSYICKGTLIEKGRWA